MFPATDPDNSYCGQESELTFSSEAPLKLKGIKCPVAGWIGYFPTVTFLTLIPTHVASCCLLSVASFKYPVSLCPLLQWFYCTDGEICAAPCLPSPTNQLLILAKMVVDKQKSWCTFSVGGFLEIQVTFVFHLDGLETKSDNMSRNMNKLLTHH